MKTLLKIVMAIAFLGTVLFANTTEVSKKQEFADEYRCKQLPMNIQEEMKELKMKLETHKITIFTYDKEMSDLEEFLATINSSCK